MVEIERWLTELGEAGVFSHRSPGSFRINGSQATFASMGFCSFVRLLGFVAIWNRLMVVVCCELVVVGALDCYGSPAWDVVVGCGGFPAWCGGLGVGAFRRGVASPRIRRCLKIDVVEIFLFFYF